MAMLAVVWSMLSLCQPEMGADLLVGDEGDGGRAERGRALIFLSRDVLLPIMPEVLNYLVMRMRMWEMALASERTMGSMTSLKSV